MQSAKIHHISSRLFRIPLKEVLSDAKHGDHSHFELITATVTLEDGREGTGYTYTGGWGGHAILAMLEHDLGVCVIGEDADSIEYLNEKMQWHVHYVGRGGIASFAISALDNALWDLRGQRSNQPLWKMAGGNDNTAAAYCGGIDLNFPKPKLLDSVQGYLAQGYGAVKIKVGQPQLKDDVERVAAVRDLLGPGIPLMVDANYAMTVADAIEAARAFKPYDIQWFEEPIIPEDHVGYRKISTATGVALAMGENQHTLHEFSEAIDNANLSFLMPDPGNCGGISVFLEVARIAALKNLKVCTHGMQELSVSLLAGIENSGMVEVHSFPIHEYCLQPLNLQNQRLIAPDVPGLGVSLNWDKLEPYAMTL